MQLAFLDKPVCRYAHMQLYGVSGRAMQNVRDGRAAYTGSHDRVEEPKHQMLGVSLRRQAQHARWPNVLAFLFLVYTSAAEILPTKLVMPRGGKFESVASEDPDFEERYVKSFMMSLEKNYDLNPAPLRQLV